jgi:hypothetical protein
VGNALDVPADLQLHGQYVGRAAGQDGQGHVRMHHAFDGFVDGAIAAGRYHQVGATGDVVAHDGAGGPRPGGGRHRDVVTVILEDFHGPPDDRPAVSPQFPRPGIVDQDTIPVSCYGVLRYPR